MNHQNIIVKQIVQFSRLTLLMSGAVWDNELRVSRHKESIKARKLGNSESLQFVMRHELLFLGNGP